MTILTILVMTIIKYKGAVLRYLKLLWCWCCCGDDDDGDYHGGFDDGDYHGGDDDDDDYHGGGDVGDGDAYLIGNGKVVKGKMRRRHCCFDSLRIL